MKYYAGLRYLKSFSDNVRKLGDLVDKEVVFCDGKSDAGDIDLLE